MVHIYFFLNFGLTYCTCRKNSETFLQPSISNPSISVGAELHDSIFYLVCQVFSVGSVSWEESVRVPARMYANDHRDRWAPRHGETSWASLSPMTDRSVRLVTSWTFVSPCWGKVAERGESRGFPRHVTHRHRLLIAGLKQKKRGEKEEALGPGGGRVSRQAESGLSHCMCLRGSQKQSRAREQRWSHTHQHRITQPWWVDLGGRRL